MGVGSKEGFDALLRRLRSCDFAGAFIVGEDLTKAADPETVRAALQKLSFLVVQDTRVTETSKLAHVVLPATHFGEKERTYTNRKGRLQKLNAALIPPEGALPDSEIFARLLELAGGRNGYEAPEMHVESLDR